LEFTQLSSEVTSWRGLLEFKARDVRLSRLNCGFGGEYRRRTGGGCLQRRQICRALLERPNCRRNLRRELSLARLKGRGVTLYPLLSQDLRVRIAQCHVGQPEVDLTHFGGRFSYAACGMLAATFS